MDLDTIIQKLQEQGTKTPEPPVLGKITIPEGYTIDQIAEVVSVDASSKSGAKTPYTQEEFLKVIQDECSKGCRTRWLYDVTIGNSQYEKGRLF